MQAARVCLKCAVCLVFLAGLALMGAKTDPQLDVPLGVPSVSTQNEESGAIVEPNLPFDEMAGMVLDIVGHRSY